MAGESNYIDEKLNLEKELLAPYTQLIKRRQHTMHSKIVLAFNHWLQVPEDKLRYILNMTKMLTYGYLLIDDIQDNSEIRDGIPAAYCVYGTPLTINTSLHVFFLAIIQSLQLGLKAVETTAKDFLNVIRGQGTEIYWRDNFMCPTEEEHNEMIKKKTASTFVMALHLMQQCSNYKNDLTSFALQIGLYFQIRDDYCNLMQQEAVEAISELDDKKALNDIFCEDLTEGKFTLPIVHAINTPEGSHVLNILRQRTRDVNLKKYCVFLLEKAGSLQYTRDVLSEMDRSIRTTMARLGGNPDMEAVLDQLLSWKK